MSTQVARQVYMSHTASQWTRADMLLALYEAAVRHVRQAMQAQQDHDPPAASLSRLKAVRVVQGIAAGVDLNRGDLGQNVLRLCEFVQHSLLAGSAQQDQAALTVLVALKEAFEGIRDEANLLESRGELPPVAEETHFELRA